MLLSIVNNSINLEVKDVFLPSKLYVSLGISLVLADFCKLCGWVYFSVYFQCNEGSVFLMEIYSLGILCVMLNCIRLTKANGVIVCVLRVALACVYTFVVPEAESFDCGIKTL